MTPGRYLRLRRQAARLRLDQLPIPGTAALAIERDARLPWFEEIGALSGAFNFSISVLGELARGANPGLCRCCGCSQFDACVEQIAIGVRAPCAWVQEDLCSACDGKPAPVPSEGRAQ